MVPGAALFVNVSENVIPVAGIGLTLGVGVLVGVIVGVIVLVGVCVGVPV